ncbi:IQ calmodulin-binding motif-containing protein [Sansalvadorimonas sp. 2012CJ34-2]|uniref:IQ calmodulin-binding motif-containing protein n=1 Tax=Parendozoicomonas callyspongiae TaxID=2942213 RepID=A0ABT0PEJ9_9GAMM|nr:IQ calmodulin-binding motif-containing protein [Sansalvadorimonas sp. 2012CJ34-2]MCL6269456.1 IQ calmodulin-binding motif-containing protein [Sansalvadorimonas sp. 2012CJ34-2]
MLQQTATNNTTPVPTVTAPKAEDERTTAAVTIQKYWRGFKVKRDFTNPSTKDHHVPMGHLSVGNDPIPYLEKFVTIKKHPAIVTTGGAQCLSNAIRLTQRADCSLGVIPKIFIIDFSQKIIEFWKLLSEVFMKSENIEQLLAKLPRLINYNTETTKFEIVIPYPKNCSKEDGISRWIVEFWPYEHQKRFSKESFPEINPENLHPRESYEFFKQLLDSDEKRFEWVKRLVTNQIYLIQSCWHQSPTSFSFVKRVCEYHDYDVYVYASNIEDTNKQPAQTLWENIRALSPVAVVKAHTKYQNQDKKTGYPVSTEYILNTEYQTHFQINQEGEMTAQNHGSDEKISIVDLHTLHPRPQSSFS